MIRVSSQRDRLVSAKKAFDSGAYRTALPIYRDLASEGNVEAQVFAGWMLAEGLGASVNADEAKALFATAAESGDAQGAFYYARWLTKSRRHVDAFRAYGKAARLGNLPATFRLGYSLVRGIGVTKDLTNGYDFLLRAAKRGHVFAIREIAIQDWRGQRGMLYRSAAIPTFAASFILGLSLILVNKHSDRLRA